MDRQLDTKRQVQLSTKRQKTPDTQITPIRRGNVSLAWPEKDSKTQERHQQIVDKKLLKFFD
jgi:hypothetical protein